MRGFIFQLLCGSAVILISVSLFPIFIFLLFVPALMLTIIITPVIPIMPVSVRLFKPAAFFGVWVRVRWIIVPVVSKNHIAVIGSRTVAVAIS